MSDPDAPPADRSDDAADATDPVDAADATDPVDSYDPEDPVDSAPPDHRVLVPVEVLRGETVPETIVRLFASVPVVLLGYHEIPEQTAPSQARMQFEEKAQTEIAALREAFEAAGGDVATRLVFTHDPLKSFERVANELGCDSVLLLNPAPTLERVLVPLRGEVHVEYISRLVSRVLEGGDTAVTLFHVAADDPGRVGGESLLADATDALESRGLDRDRIDTRVDVTDDPLEAIVRAADDHDLVVVGESKPSIRDFIFGDASEVIAERTVGPVLVVRRPYLEADET